MKDQDFDWVTARVKCSPATVFEVLRLQVEHDVEMRTRLRSEGEVMQYAFSVVAKGDNFTVLRSSTGGQRSVTFSLSNNGVAVKGRDGTPLFEATLTLNDEGECRPKINGKECEFWQLRKRALEDLFFMS